MRYQAVIEATRNEVLRLLKQQRASIQEVLQTDGLLKSEQEDKQRRNLSREEAEFLLKALDEEAKKVERLEMTLAVIGTMKAGKSTTINALVGARVLPARNQPMTTLPTLIRHTPGNVTPVLTFTKTQPFNDAIREIKAALTEKAANGELPDWEKGLSDDELRLVDRIRSGSFSTMRRHYEGVDEIFEFLKLINDLSRLCSDPMFAQPSPLEEYSDIDEFPVIEVEFHHLQGMAESVTGAQFTLIDTPGPNEAGQGRLRDILHEQLEKASAVLAVMDYTQLNSEADAEVRAAVLDVAKRYPEGLFAFVNKFDLKGFGDMGRDEVQRFVAQRLLDGHLPVDRVFPVSAQYGHLASRALRHIAEHGRLPSEEEAPWVSDFGEKAFGPLWRARIDNLDEVQRNAEALWEASLLQAPLDQVVRRAFSRAAFISLESAVQKMAELDERLTATLQLRRSAMDMSIRQVQQHIQELEQDLQEIRSEERRAHRNARELLVGVGADIRQQFHDATIVINEVIEDFFQLVKQDERRRERERQMELEAQTSFIQRLKEALRQRVRSPLMGEGGDEAPDVNKFESQEEADEFVASLTTTIAETLDAAMASLEEEVQRKISSLEEGIQENWEQRLGPILEAAENRLNEAFAVNLEFPRPTLKKIPISFDEIAANFVEVEQEERTGYHTKRKWYTLWLYRHQEPYTYTEDVYKVHTKEIGRQIARRLEERQKELQEHLLHYVQNEIHADIEQLFADVAVYLERFRGDLLDSIIDRRLEEKQLAILADNMDKTLSKASRHSRDVVAVQATLAEYEDVADSDGGVSA